MNSGESFTVEGPPMVWETSAGTFIVDDERATAEGWRTEFRGDAVIWLRDLAQTPVEPHGQEDQDDQTPEPNPNQGSDPS